MQFKDVLVDRSLKVKLANLAQTGRLAHAQFFLTQSGSHSLALAIALGQYLCCEHPTDTDSCGECPSCVQFSKLSHPDLHLYYPNCTTDSVKENPESSKFAPLFKDFVLSNNFHVDINSWLAILKGENKQAAINIRDCSDILKHNSTRSYQDGYKIYVLWCVDRLNDKAAPKLLKTLEEPEENSLFILISEEPDKILNTILSRTQLVKIPRLSDSDIAESLKLAFPNIDSDTLNDVAILADGDYLKALNIVNESETETQLLNQFDKYFSSIIAFSQNKPLHLIDYKGIQELISNISSQGREYQKQFLKFSLRMLRNILMLNTHNRELLRITNAERSVLDKFAGTIQLKQVSSMSELCNKATYYISRNGNAAVVFTDLYFQLAKAAL